MKKNLFHKIDLNKKGLQRVFGKLEVAVLEELWISGQATVRQVHERLKDKDLAYTTVMTVMSRLAAKNILAKQMHGNAFVYKPLVSSQDVEKEMVQELSTSFNDISVPALLNFIDSYQTDLETLQKLEDLLAAKMSQLKTSQ